MTLKCHLGRTIRKITSKRLLRGLIMVKALRNNALGGGQERVKIRVASSFLIWEPGG